MVLNSDLISSKLDHSRSTAINIQGFYKSSENVHISLNYFNIFLYIQPKSFILFFQIAGLPYK
jgi:hypothetical protein